MFSLLALSVTGCANNAGGSAKPTVTTAEDGTKISTDSSDFVLLADAVPDVILEIRYYSTYDFVGDRIDGYEEPIAIMTKESADALKKSAMIWSRKDIVLKYTTLTVRSGL